MYFIINCIPIDICCSCFLLTITKTNWHLRIHLKCGFLTLGREREQKKVFNISFSGFPSCFTLLTWKAAYFIQYKLTSWSSMVCQATKYIFCFQYPKHGIWKNSVCCTHRCASWESTKIFSCFENHSFDQLTSS